MQELNIEKAKSTDFESIKNLMLNALKDDPFGFSVAYEEYLFNGKEWWEKYISPYYLGFGDVMFVAKVNNTAVGIIGVIYERRERKKHTASIVWLYVNKDNRGKGTGKLLLESALEDIKTKNSVIKVTLLVNNTQEYALNLYKKYRFESSGTLKKDLLINGKYIDTQVMELFLK